MRAFIRQVPNILAIAILMALVAVLFWPATFWRPTLRPRTGSCTTNLKELAYGLLMYEDIAGAPPPRDA